MKIHSRLDLSGFVIAIYRDLCVLYMFYQAPFSIYLFTLLSHVSYIIGSFGEIKEVLECTTFVIFYF